MREDYSERDIRAFDALGVLWRDKFTIILTTAVALLLAGILYFSIPRTYEASLDIEPPRQADLSNFQGLISAELFPYDRGGLFREFMSYLRNTDLLIPVALETGVVASDPANEVQNRTRARIFARNVDFSQPDEEEALMRMRVRAGDERALDMFVVTALDRANARFAERIRFEITQRLKSNEEIRRAEIERLKVQIAARRETEQSTRHDRIEILGKQAEIARLLELDKPVGVLPVSGVQQGESVSVQVNSGDQPAFLQGYLSLEEQIRQLETRTNTDPYVEQLRQLEQEVFLLENDPNPQFRQRLLEASALNNPDDARLVHYDLVRATARKVFPTVSIFGPAALILGGLLGAAIVVLRAQDQRKTGLSLHSGVIGGANPQGGKSVARRIGDKH